VPTELVLERDGVRLTGLDFGGDGPPVVLLHGLAGYPGEWRETASWLTKRCRVIALDARGHGSSQRVPADVSRVAHVADAVFAVQEVGLDPVVVIGQSLGGQTALVFAAGNPDLARGLVLADASPAGFEDADAAETNVTDLGRSLGRWPVPFASRDAALEFFGGPSLSAEAWADGMEQRDGGWWPRFDVEVMVRTLREATSRSCWEQWECITCPTLVVRAGKGQIRPADAQAMMERGRQVRVVEAVGAEHDVHLDRPAEWRAAVCEFLDGLDSQPSDPG
jgi:pimeloyl-ACP methyl ester carboxylesterase